MIRLIKHILWLFGVVDLTWYNHNGLCLVRVLYADSRGNDFVKVRGEFKTTLTDKYNPPKVEEYTGFF